MVSDRLKGWRKMASKAVMFKALKEAIATIHTLRIRGNIYAGAMWQAVDALHKHDTPRETPTDDAVCCYRHAEMVETEREEKRMNSTDYPGKDTILAGLYDPKA